MALNFKNVRLQDDSGFSWVYIGGTWYHVPNGGRMDLVDGVVFVDGKVIEPQPQAEVRR